MMMMMMMMMMISKLKSCYITSSRNDYYSTHHNSLYMPLPDLDSRLAYPKPRPRPRLRTYKTDTGDVEYDYWGDDQGRDDAVAGRPEGGRHFSSKNSVQRNNYRIYRHYRHRNKRLLMTKTRLGHTDNKAGLS